MNKTVTKEQREEILSYGKEHGISLACRKYSISRTIYYRWKKRFEDTGIEGLKNRTRHFIPVNKLTAQIEQSLFKKVAEHPDYGPLSLKWLLEEEKIYISASGVYNILKRNNISRRTEREIFSRRHRKKRPLPLGFKPSPGQLWLCWIDERTDLLPDETVFQYSIIDVESAVSCSRLYLEKSSTHALDLLQGLAIPMGKELLMSPEIIITPRDKIYTALKPRGEHPYSKALKSLGIKQLQWDIDFNDFKDLADEFSRQSYIFLKKKSEGRKDLEELRSNLQNFLREFNLEAPLTYGPNKGSSPLENIRKSAKQKINLPLWSYLDRQY
jgi:transposase